MSWSRFVSAIVAIAIALSMIVIGGWFFTLGFCLIVFLGELEYFRLVWAKGMEPAAKTTLVLSQVLLIVAAVAPSLTDAAFPLAGGVICFYLLFQPKFATIADISTSVLGLFYGGYLPSYWIRLRVGMAQAATAADSSASSPLMGYYPHSWSELANLPEALEVTFLAFGCIWVADIGAYIMGKCVGRTQLSFISPKKTVEGAFFGILGSMIVASAGAWYLQWPFWQMSGALLGLLVGIVSLLGDLTESMMKRDAGVKDSGQIIPGHGGILDRTDSYVFTGTLVYYYVTLLLPLLATLIP